MTKEPLRSGHTATTLRVVDRGQRALHAERYVI
jgi:hypothetical protein